MLHITKSHVEPILPQCLRGSRGTILVKSSGTSTYNFKGVKEFPNQKLLYPTYKTIELDDCTLHRIYFKRTYDASTSFFYNKENNGLYDEAEGEVVFLGRFINGKFYRPKL